MTPVQHLFAVITIFVACSTGQAQQHFADGSRHVSGNRLVSVKSGPGRQLYRPDGALITRDIQADAKRTEADWRDAATAGPFLNRRGQTDPTRVRVLHDRENIYLCWEVEETEGLTATVKDDDVPVTGNDYVQVDLKPVLPDDVKHGRGYYYSIAVNPNGAVWDTYFDPYLDGFFFSSWDSHAKVKTARDGNRWTAEMVIPFDGLDVYANPGWRWELRFHHASQIDEDTAEITSAPVGFTVEQGVMVRRPNLAAYYWPRPDFMQEIKPDMNRPRPDTARVVRAERGVEIDRAEDRKIWASAEPIFVKVTDKMGEPIPSKGAQARIAMSGDKILFNLKAEGARLQRRAAEAGKLGEGMAAQMAGVNGVFIDTTLFQNECFWILLQPRRAGQDRIHQGYYMIVLDNSGRLRGTHYDAYGAPVHEWVPSGEVDLFETRNGWAAELSLDLAALDIHPEPGDAWGLNVFRNRLLEDAESELQAWRFTGSDFLNPEHFGTLSPIPTIDLDVLRANVLRRVKQIRSEMQEYGEDYSGSIPELKQTLDGMALKSRSQLVEAHQILQRIDRQLGVLDARRRYQSVPHPIDGGGYPIFDVDFIGARGWAVGPMGTILRSEDGGRSWERIAVETDADLYRVDFVNENEGWAAGGRIRMAEKNNTMRHDKRGGYAYVFHTSDGGRTWQCQYGERGRHLFGLDFVNEQTGYACGERGFLLKTEDGGRHWRPMRSTGTRQWLYGMAFKDANEGFAVGLRETVIRTRDGGRTWQPVAAPPDRRFYDFHSVYRDIAFAGRTGCIVGQDGTVLVSHDGGETWTPAATFFKDDVREHFDLRSVHFATPELGYAVGGVGSQIMVTEDGGASWSYRPVPNRQWLRAVWADEGGRIAAAGQRETVLVSENRGFDWRSTRGTPAKVDLLTLMAHGDDAALGMNAAYANWTINQGRKIADISVMSDFHSSEYEETYNLEHQRNMWMIGVRSSFNFNEFENGNNGSDYYHYTQRLWEGEQNVVRHMVAAIRACRPDVVIAHGGIFGDYDKPGHKLSGRAALPAFETAGGTMDHWPELTRLGLPPWQPKKLYFAASESYPATLDLKPLARVPLEGTNGSCLDFAEYVIRNFQSQGVYHAHSGRLSLIKSHVPVAKQEASLFDGLDQARRRD